MLRYVQPTPANGYKIVFVGDRAQLPPVGDKDSWALDRPSLQTRLGGAAVPEVELTEIVRQRAHCGILANATAVRECLRRQNFAHLRLQRGPDVAPGEVLGIVNSERLPVVGYESLGDSLAYQPRITPYLVLLGSQFSP